MHIVPPFIVRFARRPVRAAVLTALMLAALTLVRQPSPASAEWVWCWGDPVVEFEGTRVAIGIGVLGDPAVVRRNIKDARLVVYVPEGVRAEKISKNEVFFNYDVDIEEIQDAAWRPGQPIEVAVAVSFRARSEMPASLTVSYNGALIGSAAGSTSAGVVTRFTLR